MISTSGASPSFAMFGGTGLRGLPELWLRPWTDASSWRPRRRVPSAHPDARLGLPWWFQPQLGSLLEQRSVGAYGQVKYNDTAKGMICTNIAAVAVAGTGFSCNPDFSIAQIGLITRWTPVKNLTFSADVTLLVCLTRSTRAGLPSPANCGLWQAGRRVRAEGSGHREHAAPRSAQLVIRFA